MTSSDLASPASFCAVIRAFVASSSRSDICFHSSVKRHFINNLIHAKCSLLTNWISGDQGDQVTNIRWPISGSYTNSRHNVKLVSFFFLVYIIRTKSYHCYNTQPCTTKILWLCTGTASKIQPCLFAQLVLIPPNPTIHSQYLRLKISTPHKLTICKLAIRKSVMFQKSILRNQISDTLGRTSDRIHAQVNQIQDGI